MQLKVKSAKHLPGLFNSSFHKNENLHQNVANYSAILQMLMFGMKGLTNSERNFLGFHLRIPISKLYNDLAYLSTEETRSQTTGQKYLMKLEPLLSYLKLFSPEVIYVFFYMYLHRWISKNVFI